MKRQPMTPSPYMNTVFLKTNINSKLGSDAFVHITLAPKSGVPECKLNQLYKIETLDGSYPPFTARMPFFIRMGLYEVSDCFSIPSHGVDRFGYVEWLEKNDLNMCRQAKEQGLAAYFFVKEKAVSSQG